MPEAFKEKFNPELIQNLAAALKRTRSDFNDDAFVADASKNLSALELKERSLQITQALQQHLSQDFEKACEHLLSTLAPMESPDTCSNVHPELIQDWAIMPMADFVAARGKGISDLDTSFYTLYEMTKRFSAEFAIRPFLLEHTEYSLEKLHSWCNDKSHHVRRLVSEGSRPRLPWGIQLTNFVKDPHPILPLLEKLKDDKSEYVRRSVANNLNDIAKDNKTIVIDIARKWSKGASTQRNKLIKHACRTLIKEGNPKILDLYGYSQASLSSISITLSHDVLTIGQDLQIDVELISNTDKAQNLLIDYVLYHKKANGDLSPKVFKWKSAELAASSGTKQAVLKASKKHSFKPVTTRKYYAGEHKVALLINGVESEEVFFELKEKLS